LFTANLWESEFVEVPIANRDILFGSDASFWDRLNAAIDVWCSTGQPVTEYFLLPMVLASELDLSPSQVAAGRIALTREQATRYLRSSGFAEERAASFIASFSNEPITLRFVESGETFLRYTDEMSSTGSFLTRTMFDSADEAVAALALDPARNRATYVQVVTAIRPTAVLEGGIFDGWPGVTQTVIAERDAFEFALGTRFRVP
jgi:hypothetical protein